MYNNENCSSSAGPHCKQYFKAFLVEKKNGIVTVHKGIEIKGNNRYVDIQYYFYLKWF